MTDNQIIKAFKRCYLSDEINCGNCAFTNCPPNSCITEMTKSVFDLINRQKAEIDNLKQDVIPKLEWALKRANENGNSLERENQELKAEIERLKAEADELAEEYNVLMNEKDMLFDEAKTLIKQAKSEAIRDFASDLRGKAILVRTSEYSEAYYAVKTCSIGNLAIEKIRKMTEGKNV